MIRLGVFDTAIGDKSPAPPPSAALPGQAAAAARMRQDMAEVGPPTTLAAEAIVAAATDPTTPRHVLVGQDAEMMAQLHRDQSPTALFDTLHAFYHLP